VRRRERWGLAGWGSGVGRSTDRGALVATGLCNWCRRKGKDNDLVDQNMVVWL